MYARLSARVYDDVTANQLHAHYEYGVSNCLSWEILVVLSYMPMQMGRGKV